MFWLRQVQASAYGSYKELVADEKVDIIYVGTVHTMHLPHARLVGVRSELVLAAQDGLGGGEARGVREADGHE